MCIYIYICIYIHIHEYIHISIHMYNIGALVMFCYPLGKEKGVMSLRIFVNIFLSNKLTMEPYKGMSYISLFLFYILIRVFTYTNVFLCMRILIHILFYSIIYVYMYIYVHMCLWIHICI
jgi:hypothetical protein